ncbi:MAG: hypothetical protein RIE73_07280 [Coleofasciculus sp. C1-SOL-03]|uniref:hypothetical protein n=1 Tax=Coleofasciculus sp. C1-SOL-03 TaxID=3069522 RepID=UPI0032F4C69D
MLISSVTLYLVVAMRLLNKWMTCLQQDNTLSEDDKLSCGVCFVVATITWPLSVPYSYLRLLEGKNTIPQDS